MKIRRGQQGWKRFEKSNRPPPQEPWVWFTREMMESPAWGAMTAPARRVVDRILIEHMHHAGTENGNLVVTFDNFEVFGVSRRAIKPAIRVAVRLGFIDITFQGVRSHGAARRPSKYGISWLPRDDGTPPSNRWKSILTKEQAETAVKAVYSNRKAENGPKSTVTTASSRASRSRAPRQDFNSSAQKATGAKSSESPIPQ
jgi:hypothetical protein